MRDPVVREILLAFWKIHILHHAAERGVYGQWMLEELQHHGYRLSPGTVVSNPDPHGAAWLAARCGATTGERGAGLPSDAARP